MKNYCRTIVLVLSVPMFMTAETSATSIPLQLLNRFLSVESVVTIVDGRLDISRKAISTVESQIEQLKALTYGSVDYKQKDYAISVGALVVVGEHVEAELSSILALGEERRNELLTLSERDKELADVESMYLVAHRAAGEYEKIFGDMLEKGYGGIDYLLGSLVFNNWLTLFDEIVPLLARRLHEVRRVRKELDKRRTQLFEHNRDAQGWLKELDTHLERIREVRAVEAALSDDPRKAELLAQIDEGRENVERLRKSLIATNEGVRQAAERVFERQRAASKTARWLNGVLSVIQLGVSAAASDTGTGSASVSPTVEGNVSITIENKTTVINLPKQGERVPAPPTITPPTILQH